MLGHSKEGLSARLEGERERVSRFHREKKREKEEGRKKNQGRAKHFQEHKSGFQLILAFSLVFKVSMT